MPNETEEI